MPGRPRNPLRPLRRRFRRLVHDWEHRRPDPLDERLGVDTGAYVPLDDLVVDAEVRGHGHDHQAVPSGDFARIVAALPLPPSATTFVDIGAGHGRAVLLALEHGFQRVVGVEVSAELLAVAEANLAAARLDATTKARATLVHADARSVELPAGPTVLHLFNPFDDEHMAELAASVGASLQAHPRPLAVAYAMPWYPEPWDAVPELRRVAARRGVPPVPLLRRRRLPFTIWATGAEPHR